MSIARYDLIGDSGKDDDVDRLVRTVTVTKTGEKLQLQTVRDGKAVCWGQVLKTRKDRAGQPQLLCGPERVFKLEAVVIDPALRCEATWDGHLCRLARGHEREAWNPMAGVRGRPHRYDGPVDLETPKAARQSWRR